jgi:hypothetical protein
MLCPFKKYDSLYPEQMYLPDFPHIYYAFIEGNSFPDLTRDGAVLYVAPFYKRSAYPDYEYVLTELFRWFPTSLFDIEDFHTLLIRTTQNHVLYVGGSIGMDFSEGLFLFCTRYSNGNALQIANLLHESNSFPNINVEISPYFLRIQIQPSNIPLLLPFSDVLIHTLPDSSGDIVIEAKEDLINSVKVTDLSGKTVFSSTYPDLTTVHLDKSTKQGIYIVSVRLKSGQVVNKKVNIINTL